MEAGGADPALTKLVQRRLSTFADVMAQLEQAGGDAAAALAASPPDGSEAEQQQQQQREARRQGLQSAVSRAHAAWAEAQRSSRAMPLAGRAEVYQQQALPAATQLGSLLQEYRLLPEQVAAAELELAEIAACRACANLRCPRLDETTQPAGSRKSLCAGCRVVRFCGPACIKMAWRDGHKRVCAVLAAKRQQA